MIGVSVKIEIDDVLKKFDRKTQISLQRGIINSQARKAAKITKNGFSAKFNIKKPLLKISNARTTNLVARISGRKKPFSLIRFNPQESMQGVTVSVLKGQTTYIEGAFIAQPHGRDWSKSGQKKQFSRKTPLVFKRVGVKPYKINAHMLNKLHSASIGEYLKSDENIRAVNAMIQRERDNITQAIISNWTGRRLKSMGIEGGED